jgi:hypothetical protein
MTTRKPNHPGIILDEMYIKPLNLNLQELADTLGISRNTLFKIRTEKSGVTPIICPGCGSDRREGAPRSITAYGLHFTRGSFSSIPNRDQNKFQCNDLYVHKKGLMQLLLSPFLSTEIH